MTLLGIRRWAVELFIDMETDVFDTLDEYANNLRRFHDELAMRDVLPGSEAMLGLVPLREHYRDLFERNFRRLGELSWEGLIGDILEEAARERRWGRF